MTTSGKTINGKHFVETWTVSVRGTPLRRYFIDGKPVAKAVYFAEAKTAKALENIRAT